MRVSELSFEGLIALRDHATDQIWKEFDREQLRSKPSKTYESKQAEWERIKKLAAKEIHKRLQDVTE